MRTPEQRLGELGERLAADYVQNKGMRILERNYRIRGGEIDLIAQDGDEVVFIEVKARTSREFGRGVEAVDAKKQRALLRTARLYLYRHGGWEQPARFDVVELDFSDKPAHLRYWKNVIFEIT